MKKQSRGEKLKYIRRKFRLALKNPVTYLVLFILLLIIGATWVVRITEAIPEVDNDMNGWFDAVWHTIVAVVAAYYDYYALTVPGRMASLVLLLFGMALSAIVTAKVTSFIMNLQMKKNKGLKKIRKMKGHFLLCGWRDGYEKILDSVLKTNPDIEVNSLILINEAPSDAMDQLKSDIIYKDVNYINGDFSDIEVLKKAHIENATRALIISDNSNNCSSMETDSKTVLAVLSIKNLNPNIYVAAELLDEKFEEHLNLAKCDEVILTQDYQHSLLATASSGMGYSNVIKSLISDDADSGVIVLPIPEKFYGKTYGEYFAVVDKDDSINGILVGLLSDENGIKNHPLLTPDESYVIPQKAKAILVRGKDAV